LMLDEPALMTSKYFFMAENQVSTGLSNVVLFSLDHQVPVRSRNCPGI
jgi:hypothetical protein